MEKKYQLVAWTKNVTDREKARLYVEPSVELDLIEPLIAEVTECRKQQEKDCGHISLELARRFIRVYEESARLDMFTGNIDHAIRFFLQAAEYCVRKNDSGRAYDDMCLGHDYYLCRDLHHEFVGFCEEALSLARKYGFEYILDEIRPKRTLELYRNLCQG